MNTEKKTLLLLGANLIYACTSIFTKLSGMQETFSLRYFIFVGCAVLVLGTYSLIWQQILKKVPVSDAYMFKGSSLIFVLLISAAIFGEGITINNVIGSLMIVSGIVLFAKV